MEILNILMDFIVMCTLRTSGARTFQGCFLFLPYVVLWGSRYNTSQFETWYLESLSKIKVTIPRKVWLNHLPWTGVPTVFLQECYFLLYIVFVFPKDFWMHYLQDGGRRFKP